VINAVARDELIAQAVSRKGSVVVSAGLPLNWIRD
jgi:hypothetical protein